MSHYYRSFEENVPDEVKDKLSETSFRIAARHAHALVMLRDYPSKQRELAERAHKIFDERLISMH